MLCNLPIFPGSTDTPRAKPAVIVLPLFPFHLVDVDILPKLFDYLYNCLPDSKLVSVMRFAVLRGVQARREVAGGQGVLWHHWRLSHAAVAAFLSPHNCVKQGLNRISV